MLSSESPATGSGSGIIFSESVASFVVVGIGRGVGFDVALLPLPPRPPRRPPRPRRLLEPVLLDDIFARYSRSGEFYFDLGQRVDLKCSRMTGELRTKYSSVPMRMTNGDGVRDWVSHSSRVDLPDN